MSKKKKKYYVVWKGSKTGILESWEECKNSIHGFKGAQYKSFQTLELAKKAYSENYGEYKTFFESTLSKEQLAFGIYTLKESSENIKKLLQIDFNDFFKDIKQSVVNNI